jgi:predicted RNase H-like nuclease (RuvC/YqgF family)
VPTNEIEYAMKEERNIIAMKDMKIQHTIQIKDMGDQRKAIITSNLLKERDMKNAEVAAKSVQIENEKLQQELEEAKKSITMLTKALNGLEEEKRLHDEREIAHSTENSSLYSSIQKALEDIERLAIFMF